MRITFEKKHRIMKKWAKAKLPGGSWSSSTRRCLFVGCGCCDEFQALDRGVWMVGGVESRGSLETKVVISRGFWKDAKVWVDTADTLRSDFVDPQHLPFWLCFKCYTLADSFSAMLRIILAVRTWALLSAQDFVTLSIITSFRRGKRG